MKFNIYILTSEKTEYRLPKLIKQLKLYKCPCDPIIVMNKDVDLSVRDSLVYPIDYKINDEYYIHIPEPLSLGEYCCSIGHSKIRDLIVQNDDDYALILEDDAIFLRPNMFNEINNLIETIKDFDVLQLDARNTALKHFDKWHKTVDGVHYKKHGCDNNTFYNPIPSNASLCFVLSKQGAKKSMALKEAVSYITPDFLLWAYLDKIYITNEFFAIDPIIATNDISVSKIQYWSICTWKAVMYDTKKTFCNGKPEFTFWDEIQN